MSEMTVDAALRLAGAYALDRLTAARLDFDFLDTLILTSVAQANLEPAYRDADLKIAFATAETCPPDTLRRPISINALAQSMGLPFETVRRRVAGLMARGRLASNRQGVFLPAAQDDAAGLDAGYAALNALHEDLKAAGWASPTGPQSRLWTGEAPTRLAAAISTEFTLRLIRSLTTLVGDPLAVAIWLTILSGGAPMRVSKIARRLQLPSETTRRRVQALAARGLCALTDGGAAITGAQLAAPAFQVLTERSLNDLRRMFAQLSDLGVVDAWRVAPRRAAPQTIVALAA